MSVVTKRPRPANDQPSLASRKMSCVALPRPYWTGPRLAVMAVLAVFAGLSLGIAALIVPKFLAPPPGTAQQAPPFDIAINASALAPPEAIKRVASQLPVHVLRPHASPSVMDITVEDDAAAGQDQAAHQAELARGFARQGDLKQALRLQHRAVEYDPANRLYRLDLAIFYDRAGEKA